MASKLHEAASASRSWRDASVASNGAIAVRRVYLNRTSQRLGCAIRAVSDVAAVLLVMKLRAVDENR